MSLFNLYCFFLLSLLFIAFGAHENPSDLINTVCSRTQNPPYCNQVLRSDPLSKTANNLTSLAVIAIDQAIAEATSLDYFLTQVSKVVKDPWLKSCYGGCTGHLGEALGYLKDCKKLLKAKDYMDMAQTATSAMRRELDCDALFKGVTLLPEEPALLVKLNRKVQDQSDNVAVIAGFLVMFGNLSSIEDMVFN